MAVRYVGHEIGRSACASVVDIAGTTPALLRMDCDETRHSFALFSGQCNSCVMGG
jgi:hypothetical protein